MIKMGKKYEQIKRKKEYLFGDRERISKIFSAFIVKKNFFKANFMLLAIKD